MEKSISLLLFISMLIFPAISHAYIGPGAGLSAFGALIALIAAVVIAIFGFVWYPLKRLMRMQAEKQEKPSESKNKDS